MRGYIKKSVRDVCMPSRTDFWVIRMRLERMTVCLEGRCSIQLSYRTPCSFTKRLRWRRSLKEEVPSRIELLYTVLQTAASPLGQGTMKNVLFQVFEEQR